MPSCGTRFVREPFESVENVSLMEGYRLMPRIYRTQKEYEGFLIREFLGHLGYRISNPKWQERPDALLTLSKRARRKRVAVEHTDYFNDTVHGQRSPLTPTDEFWKAVQASLVRRISHRKDLTGILATVRFTNNLPNPAKPSNYCQLSRSLATELVAFVEAHPVRKSQHIQFRHRDFNGYQTLESLLSSILLSRWTDDVVLASRCSWTCSNVTTGGIGLNLSYIKTAIENKNKKANNYENWGDAREKWLLISASGSNLSNHAGPPMQNVNWADSELLDLCRNSPFDRIVFWERIRNWYKWLKPSKEVVQYKDPYIK